MAIKPPAAPEAVAVAVQRATHDLNGPLQVIVGNAYFLVDDLPPGAERSEAEEIRVAAYEAIDVVRQISSARNSRP